jgi:asparagine synthase (glutamine-hydrolysing)
MGGLVAVLSKKGENMTRPAIEMIDALELDSEAFGIASVNTIKTEASLEALKKSDLESSTAVGCAFSRILHDDKPGLMQLPNATMVFDGRTYPVDAKESEAEATAKAPGQNPEKWAATFVRNAEGDFAFAIARHETIVAGRDTVGVRPLYYAENRDFAALASERKPLWRIGLNDALSFPPGTVSLVGRYGFKFTVARRITYSEPKQVTMQTATHELHKILEHSIKKRTASLNEVAVAFSGGLDSSIIACLAKKTGANVILIHVSMENKPEVECAKQAAEALKLPLYSSLHDEHDVQKTILKVIRVIEEPDPIKVSIGIPVYWAAEKTAGMDCRVMLAGQGADEFFGGYRRYLDDYLRGSKERTMNAIFNDIVGIHEANLERDFKICNHFGVELRLPFVTYAMARLALSLPLELKMEPRDNSLRKLVLRRVAKNLGLPHFIVNKPKNAIQYTTGVNNAIKRIAQRERISMTEYCRKMFSTAFSDFQEPRGSRP